MEAYCVTRVLALIGLAALTTLVSAAPTLDACDREDTDGCSSPYNMNFPYKAELTPACNRHDICYSCAVAYGLSREDCDAYFLKDMTQVCKTISVESSPNQNEVSQETLERHRKACKRVEANMAGDGIDCERNDLRYLECLGVADTAFNAVKLFGGSHFVNPSSSYCGKSFVKSCLPESATEFNRN